MIATLLRPFFLPTLSQVLCDLRVEPRGDSKQLLLILIAAAGFYFIVFDQLVRSASCGASVYTPGPGGIQLNRRFHSLLAQLVGKRFYPPQPSRYKPWPHR